MSFYGGEFSVSLVTWFVNICNIVGLVCKKYEAESSIRRIC
jgi:hypothetical protein